MDAQVQWQADDTKPYQHDVCKNLGLLDLDHVVLLTGWRKYPDGRWAWEIQNSWSDIWGDQGYGYILGGKQDDGARYDCGITLAAFMPEIKLFEA